jgi:conjugal transfer pilus assembly protein TraF
MLIRSLLGAALLAPTLLLAAVSQDEPQEEPSKHAVERYKDGWFWYKDPKAVAKPKKQEADRKSDPQSAKHPALLAHEALQKELTESLQIATMDPTEENIGRFLGAWYEARKKSSEFADFARTFSWANPQYSRILSTNGRPSNLMAIRVHDAEKLGTAKKRVAALAKTHGLFFVFKSDCPYCHTFSPVLKEFQARYGFKVLPISLDGPGIQNFPAPQQDNGTVAQIVAQMGIPASEFKTPFIALVRPEKRELMPIGFGVMSEDEIVERIDKIVDVQAERAAQKK